MDYYVIALRLVHIVTAVLWVGSAFFFTVFVHPTAAALGPEARPFIAHLVQKRNLPRTISITSLVSIVAGALLYWEVSGGLDHDWTTSPTGIGFTVGALSAIAAFVIGVTISRPIARRLSEVGAALASGKGSPEITAEAERLGARSQAAGRAGFVLLLFATAAMAVARYL